MKSKFYYRIKIVAFATLVLFSFSHCQTKEKNKKANWLPQYDFDASQFQNPEQEFGPFARWWWPGNDVEKEELKREIRLFADNAFGGVEIQTLLFSLPDSLKKSAKVLSWDTPEYYENLRTVLKEARKRDIIVDITNGSGWPTGGPYLSEEDGILNLVFASKNIQGGKHVELEIPKYEGDAALPSKLVTVLAVRPRPVESNSQSKPILLDPSSIKVVTNQVKNDTLYWDAPRGDWKIITFWSKCNSLTGSMVAAPVQGPVLDHLDSLKVFKSCDYLFGARTGLEEYFGNPMRAIFTDSYEFAVDRHYAHDFLTYFKQNRGYDASPYFPANMQTAYNYALWKNPNAKPEFSFGSEDWRIKYDYDLTISELFQDQYHKAGSDWAEKRGLLWRTQAYGVYLDMIANAGHLSIPETESMLGAEVNLKVMASGAHLYNRPVLSAESVVFAKRAYMTTPQKTRLAVDKLFAAGVNQIIFHGIPYRYVTDETLPIGWNPFCSPGINFSSDFGEGNIFWKYQKEINEYITRTQYALRSGKSHADVIIYYPFMDTDGMPDNPEEILANGYLKNVEPPLPFARMSRAVKKIAAEKEEWAKTLYPVINQLEENGITWDWVNDASLQVAKIDEDNQIDIRGNSYQALILPDISVIQMKSAERINTMAKNGMNLLVVGKLPDKQPSYLKWKVNDKRTEEQMSQAVRMKNATYIKEGYDLNNWLKSLHLLVSFNGKYQFTRQIQRDMNDGSRIQFIWNKSDDWQPLSLNLDEEYKNAYWLNAENGTITGVEDIKNVSYVLPPYSSVILFASTNVQIPNFLLSSLAPIDYKAEELYKIDKWDITADTVSIKNTSLFDWRTNEQLRFSSNEGVYRSSFQLDELNKQASYLMDLGEVYFTAQLKINGNLVGLRINAPYSFNISKYLKNGENTIEIHVTPGQLNGLIGKYVQGDDRYKAFKGQENALMAGGLVGPVILYKK